MPFEYTNKNGKKYFLHQKGKLLYFSKEKKDNAAELPAGFEITENSSTGLPMLKKK